jgi:hypothetical protein
MGGGWYWLRIVSNGRLCGTEQEHKDGVHMFAIPFICYFVRRFGININLLQTEIYYYKAN